MRNVYIAFFLFCLIIGAHSSLRAQSYCTPGQNNTCGQGFDIYIDGIEFDSISNTASGCANTTGNSYTDYAASSYTTTVLRGKTYTLKYTASNTFDAIASVWIDYDQSYTFDAGEWTQIGTQITAGTTVSISITIPCNASLGSTRMRVRSRLYTSANGSGNSCSTFGSGEAEDYTITIADNPRTFIDAVPFQTNSLDVAPGSTKEDVLGVQVISSGCGSLNLSEMDFSYTGTTISDVTNAYLFYGGNNSSYASATQLGSVTASGGLNFSVNQNIDYDTVYFWLAFDVDANATIGNVLDADIAGITLGGNNVTVTNTSANGSRTIAAVATLNYLDVFTSNTDPVFAGSAGNDIIGFEINMNSGAPAPLTQINFNINGTTKASDISNIRLWYTGTTSYFDSTQLIGTVSSATGTLTLNLTTFNLLAGSNYFWISYDIASGATINDTVDAALENVVINGTTQTPGNGAPADYRLILRSYCVPTITTNTNSNFIQSFTIGDIQNTSSGSTSYNGNKYNIYMPSFYTTDLVRGNTYVVTFTNSTDGQRAGFWIDYNSDGTFGTSEFTSIGTNLAADTTVSLTISIPCNATLGWTRIRVRSRLIAGTLTSSDACTTFGSGEAEDYIVKIVDDNVSFLTSFTSTTADVSPKQTNQVVLGMKIVSSACFTNKVSQFDFNANGTSSLSDIKNPQVWYTGNTRTFSASNLFGSGSIGNGTYSITGNQALSNDTNYFWLTYDIDSAATLSDYVDAQCTNIIINNVNESPLVTNPKGNRQINGVMSVTSVDASQNGITTLVDKGSIYQYIMNVQLNMTQGSPINVTKLNFSTSGTNSPGSNILNARLFYSGTSSKLDTSVAFGSLVAAPNGNFSYSGNTSLAPGINYFWLTYDIHANATAGDTVDATFDLAVIDGSNYTPTTSAPADFAIISNNYCTPSYQQACGTTFIDGIEFNAIKNVGSGCTSGTSNKFTSYPITKYFTQVDKGKTYSLIYTNGAAQQIVGVWFDWDQSGTYDKTEFTLISSAVDSGKSVTTSIPIPCSAKSGYTRFRVRSRTSTGTLTDGDPCTLFGSGEAEEYVIELVDNPYTTILGPDTTICEGQGYSLDPGPSYAAVNWSTGATTRGITVNTSGTYWFTGTTNSGCVYADTITITVVPYIPSLPADTTLCGTGSAVLDAGAGLGTYLWSTGDQTQSITVTSPGQYWVMTQNALGCVGYDTIQINYESPVVNLGNDTSLCAGSTLTLIAGSYSSYAWNNGSTNSSIMVSQSGTYWVTVTSAAGCVASDTIHVTFQTIAAPNLGPDGALCVGSSKVLDAGSGYQTYLWSDGSSGNQLTVSQPGTYWVKVTNSIGCAAFDTIVLGSSSVSVFLGNDQTFCEGDSTQLDAGPNYSSYAWNTGETTRTIWAKTNGDYAVTVTNANGCSANDSVKIRVFPAPDASFTYSVNGYVVTFTPKSTGMIYAWDFGDGGTSTKESPGYLYSGAGTYTVTLVVTNGNGCKGTTTQTITLNPLGLMEIDGSKVISVYPNPTQGMFTISGIENYKTLDVFDVTGKKVANLSLGVGKSSSQSFDFSILPKGIYTIRLNQENTFATRRIVIE